MVFIGKFYRGLLTLSLLGLALFLTIAVGCAPVQTKSTGGQAETSSISEDEKQSPGQMTQEELQAELMSYADRFAVILAQGYDDFQAQAPTFRFRSWALADVVYSQAAVYTLAAEPNPEVALLDIVVVTTLGRMIYEAHHQVELGESVEPMIRAFQKLETDVWRIAAKVLSPEQQQELRDLIRAWRQENPEELAFSHMRFGDFAGMRKRSMLAEAVESGGLFASVRKATKEVEQARLLAERGIFLASRLPLLSGGFVEVWLSQWFLNPEIQKLVNDVHTVSQVSERVATIAEQLPDNVATERKNLIQDLESQEKTIRNVVGDIREMMKEGNDLISLVNETTKSVDTVSERIDAMIRTPSAGRPFDIMDYQNTVLAVSNTLVQVKSLLDEFDDVMASPDWEKRMPVLLELADGFQAEVIEESIAEGFIYGVALIFVFFLCLFGYRYATKRFLASGH